MKTLLPPERNFEKTDQWNLIYDARDRNTILSATIIATKRQETLEGMVWELEFNDFPNIWGSVPASETGLPSDKMMNFFVGKEIKVRVKGIDRKNEIVACTRKELVEENKARILSRIEEGIEFDAQVVFVTETWLGVDIGGGLIYGFNAAEARVSRSLSLNELYQEGQTIKAKVANVNKETGEINISLIDPWDNIQYNRRDKVTGTIIKFGMSNIFLEVKPGVVGIAPYPITFEPELGDKLVCIVQVVDKSKKVLHLSLLDPELIRGRKKNRSYWQNKRAETTNKLTLVQPSSEPTKTEEI